MALSYSIVKRGVAGNMRVNIVDITLDGTYANPGGYTLSASGCGVGTIYHFFGQLTVAQAATTGLLVIWDQPNGKLRLFKSGTAGATLNELATNDTLIGTSSKVRATVIGDMPTG